MLAGVVSTPGVVFSNVMVAGTHWVQTVLVLVLTIVEVVWTVLTIVLLSDVMVWVTGQVVTVVWTTSVV